MKRVNSSVSRQISSNRNNSSNKRGQNSRQEYYENNESGAYDEFVPSSPIVQKNSSGGGSNKKSSKNPSHQKSSPRYESSQQENSRIQNSPKNKKSRIREQSINLQESNVKKNKSKKSFPPQSPPKYEEEVRVDRNASNRNRQIYNQVHQNDGEYTQEEYKMRNLHENMQKLSDSLLDLRENYQKLEEQGELIVNIKNKSQLKSKKSQILPSPHKPKLKQTPSFIMSRSKQIQQSGILMRSQAAEPKNSEQVLQFLHNKQKEKQERHQKLSKIFQKEKQKKDIEEKQKEQEEKDYLDWRRSQIRQAGRYELRKSQTKEKQEKGMKALQQFLSKKWDGKPYLHQQKQKKFEEKQQEQFKQKRSQILADKKQVFKPMNLQEIDQHQKWFFAKRDELDQAKKLVSDEKYQKLAEKNAAMPQFWKGFGHEVAAKELKQIQDKKKQPAVKNKKMKDYQQYIQQNFQPRTKAMSARQGQETAFDPTKFMKVKRYRYYKGIAYGQVSDTQPIAKSVDEIKKIGNHNMELMKKLPRKLSEAPKIYSYTPQPAKKHELDYVHRIFEDVVEEHREKEIKVSVPENLKRDEIKALLDKLKSHDKRLDQKQKALSGQRRNEQNASEQKELNQNVVDNIERKLSVLSQL